MKAIAPQKKKQPQLETIYSKCLLTRKICLPMIVIGKNLNEVIEDYIKNNYEGKCSVEGYIKPNSCKIISYSSGVIERGSNVAIEVVFECDVCFLVEGMKLKCSVKSIVKSGVRAESATDVPSPIIVYVLKDHHINNQRFNELQIGDVITVKVIGQRFELNDKHIELVCELVKDEPVIVKQKKTRIAIKND